MVSDKNDPTYIYILFREKVLNTNEIKVKSSFKNNQYFIKGIRIF